MTKRKKVSPSKAAFRKEVRRIERFIKRAEKRGFTFPSYTKPVEPTQVRKRDIEKLKKIKPETLYSQALYVDRLTGEVYTGTERRTQERKESSAKGWRTKQQKKNKGEPPTRARQILYYIQNALSEYESRYPKGRWCGRNNFKWVGDALREFVNELIAEEGQDAVIARLNEHPEVKDYTDIILFDSDDKKAENSLSQFLTVMSGRPLTADEAQTFGTDSDYNDDLDELPL